MSTIEIITIGDELLEGRLVDTNAATLSDHLFRAGLLVTRHTSVGDDGPAIVDVLRAAASRSDAVLVTGGLGPTSDDLTAASAAEAFHRRVERVPEALEHARRFFVSRGREMSPNNAKQADLPAGSEILPNPLGTAVGFRLDSGSCRLYFMPGVPQELEGMVTDTVLPDLRRRLEPRPVRLATVKVFGRGESDVAQLLEGLGNDLPDGSRLLVQYRATFPEIHVRLVLRGPEPGPGVMDRLLEDARGRLGRHVFVAAAGDVAVAFPDAVAARLAAAGATVALAEGGSAGEATSLLAASPDGAAVLAGGVVVPTPGAASSALGLGDDEPGLAASPDGATSERLAVAVRERFGSTFGAATLGLAGDGDRGGDVKPGSLWVGISGPGGTRHRALRFPVEGARFRRLAAYVALGMVAREMERSEA